MRITESALVEAPAVGRVGGPDRPRVAPAWRPALREFRQVSEGPLRVGPGSTR